jgi:uncharacterized protein (DUF2236 family)
MAELDVPLGEIANTGLFGPGSVAWKIHSHPVLVVGGFRALIIQALHPLAMAGVTHHSAYASDPLGRFHRTAQYVHKVVFADTATARAAAEHVRRVHERIRGTDPVTGREYYANDPEILLWVHCVQAYSAIVSRRVFVGDLSDAQEEQYLREFVAAGELIGIPGEMIPASRDEYRSYFAAMLPSLCAGRTAHETIAFVARPDMRLVPPRDWPFAVNLKWAGHAAATLVPHSLQKMSGLPRPGAGGWALRRWTAIGAKAMERALGHEPFAARFDRIAARRIGTVPVAVRDGGVSARRD